MYSVITRIGCKYHWKPIPAFSFDNIVQVLIQFSCKWWPIDVPYISRRFIFFFIPILSSYVSIVWSKPTFRPGLTGEIKVSRCFYILLKYVSSLCGKTRRGNLSAGEKYDILQYFDTTQILWSSTKFRGKKSDISEEDEKKVDNTHVLYIGFVMIRAQALIKGNYYI